MESIQFDLGNVQFDVKIVYGIFHVELDTFWNEWASSKSELTFPHWKVHWHFKDSQTKFPLNKEFFLAFSERLHFSVEEARSDLEDVEPIFKSVKLA